MFDDIRAPGTKKSKPAPKPKPEPVKNTEPESHFHVPVPDFTINEDEIDDKPAKNQRKLLIAPHKHFIRFWRWWTSLNRNLRFGIIAAVLLLFAAGAVFWYEFIQPNSNPSISIGKHAKKVPPAPTTVASPLTGLQVDPGLAKRPVTGIMIENSDDARPQSGLQDAGVVYEAIAEAGITRFLALFQDAAPQYIGPVRSLRPYYIDYAAPFQASIVHVGGSPDALSKVTSGGYRNLDQFSIGSPTFQRITARQAPHNVYTSFSALDNINQSRGYTSSAYTTWPRKADKKIKVPTAKTIDLQISSADFYSHYDYDTASNSYLRSEGGAPHMDLVSSTDSAGVQLKPKVVIAIVVPQSQGALDASGAYYTEYQTSGSGQAYIFQDGGVTVGTWQKNGTSDQISFATTGGTAVPINAGQTWITLVSSASKVSYKP